MSTQQQPMKQQPIQQSMQQPVLGLPMRSKSAFPDGFFFIQSKAYPSLTIDVHDGSLTRDANLILWTKKDIDNVNQLWAFEKGFLVNKKSGLVMDIRGGDVTAGKNIIQWTRKGVVARNQEWAFKDGFICPVSNERLALDVESSKGNQGSNIVLATRNIKRPGQQWNIIEHNPPELMTIHKLLLPLTDEEREIQRNTGIRLSNLCDWHRKVYKEQSTQATDQEIAGAAAFEAIRMYIQQCRSNNTPISDTKASSSIASLVTQEIVKLTSNRNTTGDRSSIEYTAQAVADSYFGREYAMPA
ncbi:unnamed protein product [Umbelopsis vinacea]